MPRVVPYSVVTERMTADGFVCAYPNGGAFRPVNETPEQTLVQSVAWIGRADTTIRESVRPICLQVNEPYAETLSQLAIDAWQTALPGPLWLQPATHWAAELQHDSADWLATALEQAGVDMEQLAHVTQAAAIEFEMHEAVALRTVLQTLLERLRTTDFYLAFPGRATVCIVHHHGQLWWTSMESEMVARLRQLVQE